MMYLPLDQMIKNRAGSSDQSSSSGGSASSSGQMDIQSVTDQVLRELRNRQTANSRTGR
jgi:membrane protease subunit HflK